MPYVNQNARIALNRASGEPVNVGELTYVLYRECLRYLGREPRYADFAEVLGALEATKLELYRRQIAPYEDGKLDLNGDVLCD